MLPVWFAVIVHVPTATSVTAVPETVQIVGVCEVKLIGSPVFAEATSANVPLPSARLGSVSKVIVLMPAEIRKLWVTSAAAR